MLKLEINKSYVTRNGGVVMITIQDKTNQRLFGGYLECRGSVFYTESGRYDIFKETEFDLIEECAGN